MRALFTLLLLITTVYFCSCNNDNSHTIDIKKELGIIDTAGENVGSALDIFVDTFLKSHPDISNNDITFENASNDFSKEFTDQLKTGLLDTMTFYCGGVERDVVSKKSIATFSTGATSKDSSYSIHMYVEAPIDEAKAAKFKEGSMYKIQGTITRPEDKLAEKYHSRPSDFYFSRELDRIKIDIFRLQLNLQNFTLIK